MVYREAKYLDKEASVIECKNVETRVDSNTLQIVDKEKLELLCKELSANSYDYIKILFAHITTIITTKDNIIDSIQKIIRNHAHELSNNMYNDIKATLYHVVSSSEIKNFYEHYVSLIINGIECLDFEDTHISAFGNHEIYSRDYFGFIDVNDNYQAICNSVSNENLKEILLGNVFDGCNYCKLLVSKKCIDKIIVRKRFLHTDLIETGLEKFYTGEEETIVLDPNNPNPDILRRMLDANVLKESGSNKAYGFVKDFKWVNERGDVLYFDADDLKKKNKFFFSSPFFMNRTIQSPKSITAKWVYTTELGCKEITEDCSATIVLPSPDMKGVIQLCNSRFQNFQYLAYLSEYGSNIWVIELPKRSINQLESKDLSPTIVKNIWWLNEPQGDYSMGICLAGQNDDYWEEYSFNPISGKCGILLSSGMDGSAVKANS